jgi:hypothetical protein
MLHGRLLAGLAAQALERDTGETEFQFVRLTVDLFRSPPMAPVQVSTKLVRDGHRVRAADASVTSAGIEVARVSALMLRRAEQPPVRIWQAAEWSVPGPDELSPVGEMPFQIVPITPGGFEAVDQKRFWIRDTEQLIEGEDLSPFVRAALAADFASPLANSGEGGVRFINADITLYLSIEPRSEWLGLEVGNHLSAAGVAVGQCTLYDTVGAIGHIAVAAVANAALAPRESR